MQAEGMPKHIPAFHRTLHPLVIKQLVCNIASDFCLFFFLFCRSSSLRRRQKAVILKDNFISPGRTRFFLVQIKVMFCNNYHVGIDFLQVTTW